MARDQNGDALANLSKLPETCAAILQEDGCAILLKRGVPGYWPAPQLADAAAVRAFNERLGITPRQVNAMQHGSLFGWHVKLADPDCDANARIDPYRG